VERASSRAGLSPVKSSAFSRRTLSTITAFQRFIPGKSSMNLGTP
jgi:hypothetical protein